MPHWLAELRRRMDPPSLSKEMGPKDEIGSFPWAWKGSSSGRVSAARDLPGAGRFVCMSRSLQRTLSTPANHLGLNSLTPVEEHFLDSYHEAGCLRQLAVSHLPLVLCPKKRQVG